MDFSHFETLVRGTLLREPDFSAPGFFTRITIRPDGQKWVVQLHVPEVGAVQDAVPAGVDQPAAVAFVARLADRLRDIMRGATS
jgi:hypothetical protein